MRIHKLFFRQLFIRLSRNVHEHTQEIQVIPTGAQSALLPLHMRIGKSSNCASVGHSTRTLMYSIALTEAESANEIATSAKDTLQQNAEIDF